MTFPSGWIQLPGPADFLSAVVDFLADENSVFVGLPDDAPAGNILAVEVAESIRREGIGRWEVLRPTDPHVYTPLKYVVRNFDGRDGRSAGTVILWVDAVRCDSLAAVWEDYARRHARLPGGPRICLAMGAARAGGSFGEGLDTRLQRCLWRDFVTGLDSRVLTERYLRSVDCSADYTALKSVLVATLAGADLATAHALSQLPLRNLLDTGRHPQHLVWEAQIPILFPVIDRARRDYIRSYGEFWNLPHQRENRQTVWDAEKLDVGDLAFQASGIRVLRNEVRRLEWLRRVRNALAHNDVVPWGTLNSPDGEPFVNFDGP